MGRPLDPRQHARRPLENYAWPRNTTSPAATPIRLTAGASSFDQLYPTGHDKLGLADQVGWKNIRDSASIVELTPHKGWPVTASLHSWWLADTHDASLQRRRHRCCPSAERFGRQPCGRRIDVQVTHPLTPQVQLAAGIAHVFPAKFLDTVTPGAHYTYPFVMVTYVFLAAK